MVRIPRFKQQAFDIYHQRQRKYSRGEEKYSKLDVTMAMAASQARRL